MYECLKGLQMTNRSVPAMLAFTKHSSFVPLAIAMTVGLISGCEEKPKTITPPPKFSRTMTTPFLAPPIANPDFVTRSECDLPDHESVIGILLKEGPRAYPLKALAGMQSHVVYGQNDQESYAVTYCDRTDCSRVFRQEGKFQISTGGLLNGELSLVVNGKMYQQNDPSIPLNEHPHTVTTLGEWMEKQPESLVYKRGQPSTTNQK